MIAKVFQSFQATADYCLTYSNDSSEGDYDPTRECFMVELVDGQIDDVPSDDENGAPNPLANPAVVPAAPRPATSASSAVLQVQLAQLQELESMLEEEQ